jgi:hypothetical protein
MMMKMTSDRLHFRRWSQSDLQRVLEIYRNPEVYRFMGNPPAPIKDEQGDLTSYYLLLQ